MRTANLLALAAAIGLAGCTVGPNYVRPTTDAPTAWRIDYPPNPPDAPTIKTV